MKEIWKDIEGYEGYYQVSNIGKIKSFKRFKRDGKILKNLVVGKGYYAVNLCKGGEQTSNYVHRLVAKAFIKNKENLTDVNHIDFNRLNNDVNNLEWVSRFGNMRHYYESIGAEYDEEEVVKSYKELSSLERVGKKHKICDFTVVNILKRNNIPIVKTKKHKHPHAKTIDMYSLENEFIKRFYYINGAIEFLKKNGWEKAHRANILKCINGSINTSYGCKWKYVGKTKDLINKTI